MNLATARARYLSAIGAMLPSLAMAACKDPPPPGVAMTDGAAVTTTPSATATATPSASDATPPASAVASTTGPVGPLFHMPSCPSGAFCIAEGAKVDAKTAAPAPYGKCALTTPHPEDVKADAGPGIGRSRSVSFSAENTAAERTKTAKACCYTWVVPCPGGRAFRDATGTPTVARTIDRADWTAVLAPLALAALSREERWSLAAHWTREAAFEHASIASFAQLTLDLLAVGAPPELLAATQRATLDEIEHARICFALATVYGAGSGIGPAPLAAMPGAHRTLADIARTTFIDACVGESVASAALADQSRQATDPALRELLGTMAEDEERHAELAWRIVAWTLRTGDPEVAQALAAAQSDVVDELVTMTRGPAASRNELRATVLREVVLPCAVALLVNSAPRGAASSPVRDLHD